MHAADFVAKRDSVIKAFNRGMITQTAAYNMLTALYVQIGYTDTANNHKMATQQLSNRG